MVHINLNGLKWIICVHIFEIDSTQSEMTFILLFISPRDRTRWGSWVGAPQFGEKIEGDMDLPYQGTVWRKNSHCGAVHHILENWSYEQDTDLKEHLCSWLWPGKGCRFVQPNVVCAKNHTDQLWLSPEPDCYFWRTEWNFSGMHKYFWDWFVTGLACFQSHLIFYIR